MKYYHIFFLFIAIQFTSTAQHINWLTFEEAIEKNQKEPKNILIDVYTDWCGYCKKMDRETYENKEIVKLINKNFYAVKLNAEQREDITYKDKTFTFVKNGRRGYHQFAAGLLQGKMSYPSTVFLDKNEAIIDKIPGYLTPVIMEKILVYLGNNMYKDTSFEKFQETFVSKL